MNLNTHGTVIGISPKTSRIAVKLHDGDISIMEVDDLSDFAINHVLYGPLDEETEQVIFNKTEQTEHYVYIQATGCNAETAEYQLFRA
ncbi:hypothetical protein [Shewanella sp.]|jgi:hypothetical protein|uniref:hypothetical protein n=1 Tax=Shewanella sp. TaxID=50422 RepID=UPI0040538E09